MLFVADGGWRRARAQAAAVSEHTIRVARATRRALGIRGGALAAIPEAKLSRMAEHYSGNISATAGRVGWYSQVFLPNGDVFAGVTEEDIVARTPAEVASRMKKDKSLQVRIPMELHTWLKAHAASKGITITDIIVSYLLRLKKQEERHVTGVPQI